MMQRMKLWMMAAIVCGATVFTACTSNEDNSVTKDDGHVIVDVRREDEYKAGHIPGAIRVTNEDIGDTMPAELPDLDQIILVYCRSGRRSKEASEKLAKLGYTNVYEFGGIIDWDGEVVK